MYDSYIEPGSALLILMFLIYIFAIMMHMALQVGGTMAGFHSKEAVDAATIKPFVQTVVKEFGFDRLVFEANWFFCNFLPDGPSKGMVRCSTKSYSLAELVVLAVRQHRLLACSSLLVLVLLPAAQHIMYTRPVTAALAFGRHCGSACAVLWLITVQFVMLPAGRLWYLGHDAGTDANRARGDGGGPREEQ